MARRAVQTLLTIFAAGLMSLFAVAASADIVNSATASARYGDVSVQSDPSAQAVVVGETVGTLALTKTISNVEDVNDNARTDAGDVVHYDFSILNTGTLSLFQIVVTDPLAEVVGDPVPVLEPGESSDAYTATYVLTQENIDAGFFENSALADATLPPTGEGEDRPPVSDVSDAGDEATETPDALGALDEDPTNDPTVLVIEQIASVSFEKSLVESVQLFPSIFESTFEISVENTGVVTLTELSVVDDLSQALVPARIWDETNLSGIKPVVSLDGFDSGAANSGFDGSVDTELLASGTSLAPGSVGTITVTLRYTSLSADGRSATSYPTSANIATVSAPQLEEAVSDSAEFARVSENGDILVQPASFGDRDGDGRPDSKDFDPQGYFYCENNGVILTGGRIAVYDAAGNLLNDAVGLRNDILIIEDGSTGRYQWISVGAEGTFEVRFIPPAGTVIAPSPQPTSTPLVLSEAVDAYSNKGAPWVPGTIVALGSGEFLDTGILATYSGGKDILYNTYWTHFRVAAGDPIVVNNNIPLANCDGLADVVASKFATPDEALLGEDVRFDLNFEIADALADRVSGQVIDLLPVGLTYVPGSATLNGSASEPDVDRNRLIWSDLSVSAGDIISISYRAVINPQAPVGAMVNRTWFETAYGFQVSNVAEATVRRRAEAVFDCSDIIGRVYDDQNHNTYNDDGEPGIPGAVVVTLGGVRITADAHGRFNVPCAALPKDIGSNFQLKLDERSLPNGYRVTTENPLVVRLTPGRFAKMNFGAALMGLVEIDLTAAAFDANGEPSNALRLGIAALVEQLTSRPSTVELTYIYQDEGRVVARQRLQVVERLLRRQWRKSNMSRLPIELETRRGN